jgi:glutamate formiminotransferase/formiminotetrahydrofolate cyclodeaminase
LPKKTEEEKLTRKQAIQNATRYAIDVPFKVMQLCYGSMEVMKAMAEFGNPNSVTDAGVGAIAARSGVYGAFLNVKINSASLNDKEFVAKVVADGQIILEKSQALESIILDIVNKKIAI